jgi:acyl-CoA reductase-like NAD-dependent aldehyde dehydrogenase
VLEAWHLPGLDAEPAEWLESQTPNGARFRAPALSAAQAGTVAQEVRRAALEARFARTSEQVIRSIAAAATKLADDGPEGVAARGLLRAELGWDEHLARDTLDGMARTWTAEALTGLVEAELGGPAVLDGFVPDAEWVGPGHRSRRALGAPVVLQVLAGNVPGVAITAAIRALLVRSGVLCKLPGAEPGLLPLFARVLFEEDALLGRCVAATWWPGDSFPAAWREWARWAGRAVVYGSHAAVEAARGSLPADTDLISYGPRTGIGVVLPDTPPGAVAELARDVCAYDHQGCVSPRLVYVVGESTRRFVEDLARALEEHTRRHPPPDPTAAEAVAIRAARTAVEFGGYDDGRSAVTAPGDSLAWTILAAERPAAQAESLPRVVWVHHVPDVETLEDVLRPLEGRIQTLGYSGSEELQKLAGIAARLGVSRIAPFGTVAWPPPDWRHEGRYQLLPLLNWTDLETPE